MMLVRFCGFNRGFMIRFFAKPRNHQHALPTRAWRRAQRAERGFWVHFIRDELRISSREQLVGFRLCEGRVHLCAFGHAYSDWMYSMDPPVIAGKVLDLGCSVVSVFEKCRSVSVVAIDPLLDDLSQALPGLVVVGKINNCEYRCCRIQDVPEVDFDVVWCNNVLDHTEDWSDIIRHAARVLKPSGLLYVGTDVRSDSKLLDVMHISAITAEGLLAELETNGFEVVWQSSRNDAPQYRFSVRALRRGE